jgi:hypothetical protein
MAANLAEHVGAVAVTVLATAVLLAFAVGIIGWAVRQVRPPRGRR